MARPTFVLAKATEFAWLLSLLSSACVNVHASQRRELGHPLMDLDADATELEIQSAFLEHREGSVGGRGGGGSGCGCN